MFFFTQKIGKSKKDTIFALAKHESVANSSLAQLVRASDC